MSQPHQQPYGFTAGSPITPPSPPKSPWAMASFFVALASPVLPMFFPAALVLGIVALRDVKKTKRDGKVFAVVGVVVGGLQTVIAIGMILWWVFVDQPS